jgi:hypothetical protein
MFEIKAKKIFCPLILMAFVVMTGSLALAQEAPEAPEPPAPEVVEGVPEVEVEEAPVTEVGESDDDADDREDDSATNEGAGDGTFTFSVSDSRGRGRHSITKDTQIHFGSDLEVDEDEVARDAIVIGGALRVDGKVIGDAVAILGSVTINGEVTGEVAAVGASVYLGEHADVTGDIVSVGGRVERHPDARVLGQITEVDFGPAMNWSDMPMFWTRDGGEFWNFWNLGVGWNLFWTSFKWIMMILLVSLIFLIAREPIERTSRQLRAEPWKSSLLGLVALVFFPFVFVMVCVLLAITIIGIPLLIVVVPFVILLLFFALILGYTSAAYSVGSWFMRRFGWGTDRPYVALMVGVVAIQSLSLVARLVGSAGGMLWFFTLIFGLAGWFVRFVAWTSGFGAALLTQLGRLDPIGEDFVAEVSSGRGVAESSGASTAEPAAPAAPATPAAPAAPAAPASSASAAASDEPGGSTDDDQG